MGAKITIEQKSTGWIEIFKSQGMQSLVDGVGERVAAEAGEHFYYNPGSNNRYTAGGFVSCDGYGAIEEAEDKVLTKAVHK